MSDAVVFGGMLIDSSALLGINIYSLITLSDLECDYLNAPTACSKLNSVILVKKRLIHRLLKFLARNNITSYRSIYPLCYWTLDTIRSQCPSYSCPYPQIQLSSSWEHR